MSNLEVNPNVALLELQAKLEKLAERGIDLSAILGTTEQIEKKAYFEEWRKEVGNFAHNLAKELHESGRLPKCTFQLRINVIDGKVEWDAEKDTHTSVEFSIDGISTSRKTSVSRSGKRILFRGKEYSTYRSILDELHVEPKGASAHVVLDSWCKKNGERYEELSGEAETSEAPATSETAETEK